MEGDKAEELSGEGGPAAGDADLMDNSNQEDQDTSGSAQEEEKLPEEPVLKDAVVIDKVQPIPVLVSGVRPKSVWVQQRSLHYNFQWWHFPAESLHPCRGKVSRFLFPGSTEQSIVAVGSFNCYPLKTAHSLCIC